MDRKTSLYDEFRCTASECPITCCGQWKIDIDDDTYARWNTLGITGCETYDEGRRIIKLNEKRQCPNLTKEGLCSLVIKYGDEILSETCTVFPRQINDFGGVKEYSLVNCCPAVIDMLSDSKFEHEKSSEGGLFAIRDMVVDIVNSGKYSLSRSLFMSFCMLSDMLERKDTDASFFNEYYFDELNTAIDNLKSGIDGCMTERNELFLDVCENYRKQGIYDEFLKDRCSNAEEGSFSPEDEKNDFDGLLRKCISSELYANLYLPEYDISDTIIAFEWIVMEYVCIRQAFLLGDEHDYKEMRRTIVIISRMMGYDNGDIMEYMENSFEDVIWPAGYMALLLQI